MNWSKAKTILIVIMLLLNVFLLAMTLFTNPTSLFANNYNRYAQSYLQSRNIEINTDIPKVPGTSAKIMYTAKEYDPEKLCTLVFGGIIPGSYNENSFFIEKGNESISLSESLLIITDHLNDGEELFSNSEKLKERLLKYMEALDFDKKSIVAGETEAFQDVKQIKFYIKYKSNFVFDHEITAKLSNEGLLTLWAPTKNVSNGNKGSGSNEILSAYQILVMGGLPAGARIEGVDFGYKQISEGDIFGNPVWRVILDDGTVLFYNAYTGVKL